MRRWEENCNKEISWGPMTHYETVNAQNRQKIMAALLFVFNQHLSMIQKPALYHMCKAASQLVNLGFSLKHGHAHRSSYGSDPNMSIITGTKPVSRVTISSQLLLEFLHAIYFAMFNEFASVAIQAVDDIHHRASYELYADVVLVTNAVKNSLHANPTGKQYQLFYILLFNINYYLKSIVLNDWYFEMYFRSTIRWSNGNKCCTNTIYNHRNCIKINDYKCIIPYQEVTW